MAKEYHKVSGPMDPLLVTLANFTSDAHLVAHVEMLFQTLDTDDSQSLSYDELRAGLSKMDFDPPIRLSIEDWQQFTNHGEFTDEVKSTHMHSLHTHLNKSFREKGLRKQLCVCISTFLTRDSM